ncbi:peptidase [Rosenbergiella collisarenosi]|uniref:peptidase n=1 Tax=Rosenbergiella collisarenosi TaxID=1544695 RepID=UPI001BDA7DD1|nr:peptidase [Rosenbergiella collisarenosi]MBT0722471.1 peptidase [Rosenbergiella collisarenosi]
MAFPSPAQNYTENRLDLNDFLKLSAYSHYFMISEGHYPAVGILKGALLIIDRALNPKDGSVVIAEINNGLELRRLTLSHAPALISLQNPDDIIGLAINDSLPIWGVISYVLNDMAELGFNPVGDRFLSRN